MVNEKILGSRMCKILVRTVRSVRAPKCNVVCCVPVHRLAWFVRTHKKTTMIILIINF